MALSSHPRAMVDFKTWQELDLRVGKVIEAEAHPDADKLIVLKVDLGSEARQIVAGLREHYEPEALVGRSIVVLVNLEPAKLRGIWSQGMLLAGVEEGGEEGGEKTVTILTLDREVAPGTKVS